MLVKLDPSMNMRTVGTALIALAITLAVLVWTALLHVALGAEWVRGACVVLVVGVGAGVMAPLMILGLAIIALSKEDGGSDDGDDGPSEINKGACGVGLRPMREIKRGGD
jgi:preprotein translocase subunit SecF